MEEVCQGWRGEQLSGRVGGNESSVEEGAELKLAMTNSREQEKAIGAKTACQRLHD